MPDSSPNRPRNDSVTTHFIEDFSSLQLASHQNLYDNFTSQYGRVDAEVILDFLSNNGILEDDARLHDLFPEDHSAPLSFSDFCCLLSKSSLVSRCLEGSLVIPEWKSFQSELSAIFHEVSSVEGGEVAQYIPQLARVDPSLCALAVCSTDGQRYEVGDINTPFSVQSCSKPLTYCIALEELGEEKVHSHVSTNPSGRGFNVLCLDSNNRPHNVMINAGAIVCSSLIKRDLKVFDRFRHVQSIWSRLAGNTPIAFDNATYLSEFGSADRNSALAYMMKEHGVFPEGTDIDEILSLYFMFCSIQVCASQMATVAATLANGGINPFTRERIFSETTIRNCLSQMTTSGLYDYSGAFAYHVSLPTKSSVSGCLMIVIPGLCGICYWSPPLDSLGNSVKGIAFSMELAKRFNVSQFECPLASSKSPKLRPRKIEAEDTLEDSQTMLLFASAVGDVDRVQRLVARGINVNFRDYDMRSALHTAAAHNQLEVVQYLIKHGADVTAVDKFDRTAYDDAIKFGHRDVANVLAAYQELPQPSTPVANGNSGCCVQSGQTLLEELDFHEDVHVIEELSCLVDESILPVSGSSDYVSSDDSELDSEIVEIATDCPIAMSLDLNLTGTVSKRVLLSTLERAGILAKYDARLSQFIKNLSTNICYSTIEQGCSEIPLLRKALLGNLVITDFAFTMSNLRNIFDHIASQPLSNAMNADYISDLKNQDPSLFAFAICSVDGQRGFIGDYNKPFTLQHCSNALTYCLASSELGEEAYHSNVGLEPSGLPFNHLSLNHENKPHNPFINTGALFSASVIARGQPLSDRYDYVLQTCLKLIGNPRGGRLKIDHIGYSLTTYLSELQSSDRNRALLYLMREYKVFPKGTNLDEILRFYSMLCSIEFNTASLSVFAATLANNGVCPLSGEQVFSADVVRNCLALMSSCSMYDYSGHWQFIIGLPGVAAASGALLVVVPGISGIAIFSPPLNESKISSRGIMFCKELQAKYLLHPMEMTMVNYKKNLKSWRNNTSYLNHARLCFASFIGDISTVRNYIRHRVSVSATDYDGRSALHLSTAAGHLDVVKMLLDLGADPFSKDIRGITPLQIAQDSGNLKCLALFEAKIKSSSQ
ncbi:hypothetical protein RCL1_005676 [Eukaryota sp. TZLM3-RCL]